MRVDIVLITLLALSIGTTSASARGMRENFASNNVGGISVLSPDWERNKTSPVGSDIANDNGQSVVGVKFELRHAPQVSMTDGMLDEIIGTPETTDIEPAVSLHHRSFAYFTQPDGWYVLPLVLLLLLMQIRALPMGRTRTRESLSHGNGELLQVPVQSIPMKEAFE